jgi:hypothetical protein
LGAGVGEFDEFEGAGGVEACGDFGWGGVGWVVVDFRDDE